MNPNTIWKKKLQATGLQTMTQVRTKVLHPSKMSSCIPRQSQVGCRQPQLNPPLAPPAGTNHTKPFGAATGIMPKHQGRRKSAARQAPTCSASKLEEHEPRQTGFSGQLRAHPPRLSRFLTRLRPPPREVPRSSAISQLSFSSTDSFVSSPRVTGSQAPSQKE